MVCRLILPSVPRDCSNEETLISVSVLAAEFPSNTNRNPPRDLAVVPDYLTSPHLRTPNAGLQPREAFLLQRGNFEEPGLRWLLSWEPNRMYKTRARECARRDDFSQRGSSVFRESLLVFLLPCALVSRPTGVSSEILFSFPLLLFVFLLHRFSSIRGKRVACLHFFSERRVTFKCDSHTAKCVVSVSPLTFRLIDYFSSSCF